MPWQIQAARNPDTNGRGASIALVADRMRVMLDEYDVLPYIAVTLAPDARVRDITEHADDTMSIGFESDSGELRVFFPFGFHTLMNALSLTHDFPQEMADES